MVGASDSVIGAKKEDIINSFLTQMPFKYDIADGPSTFNAVLIELNDSNGMATEITPIIQNFDNN